MTKISVKLGKHKDLQGNIVGEKRRDNGSVVFVVKLDKGDQESFAFHEVQYYNENLQEA
jgi:hypothetical protein